MHSFQFVDEFITKLIYWQKVINVVIIIYERKKRDE